MTPRSPHTSRKASRYKPVAASVSVSLWLQTNASSLAANLVKLPVPEGGGEVGIAGGLKSSSWSSGGGDRGTGGGGGGGGGGEGGKGGGGGRVSSESLRMSGPFGTDDGAMWLAVVVTVESNRVEEPTETTTSLRSSDLGEPSPPDSLGGVVPVAGSCSGTVGMATSVALFMLVLKVS